MTQWITQGIKTDRLDLTDLLPISDLMLQRGMFRFRVAGWSMYPTLRKGDALTVEPVSPAQLQAGDLLLFHHLGRLICHRLVAMQETGAGPRLITKGDAATWCDVPLQPEQVLGRVMSVRQSWHWAGPLPKRIDSWLARFRDEVAQGLLALQGLRSYRRMMRALLSRCFSYDVGIAWGSRWYQYQRLSETDALRLTRGHDRLHLLAKLGRSRVGSLRISRLVADTFCLEALYVRTLYRGLGVGSQLLALAIRLAGIRHGGAVHVTIDPDDRAACGLFEKLGFRLAEAAGPSGPLVLLLEPQRPMEPASQTEGGPGRGPDQTHRRSIPS